MLIHLLIIVYVIFIISQYDYFIDNRFVFEYLQIKCSNKRYLNFIFKFI